jgi:hypothetical protein
VTAENADCARRADYCLAAHVVSSHSSSAKRWPNPLLPGRLRDRWRASMHAEPKARSVREAFGRALMSGRRKNAGMPLPGEAAPVGVPLPGGARDIGGDDVGRMPVQAAAGPVIPHGGSRICTRGGFLDVAQRDPIVTGREQCSDHAEYLSLGGRLEATPGVAITGTSLPGRAVGPGQERPSAATAMRAGHVRGTWRGGVPRS